MIVCDRICPIALLLGYKRKCFTDLFFSIPSGLFAPKSRPKFRSGWERKRESGRGEGREKGEGEREREIFSKTGN